MSKKSQPPAFILGKRPDFVEVPVTLDLPDGGTASIVLECEYRTRKEFGELWDDIAKASQESLAPAEGEEVTYKGMFGKGNATNAANAMKYVKAWRGIDVDVNAANLEQLFDEIGDASSKFWDGYRNRIVSGRLGN